MKILPSDDYRTMAEIWLRASLIAHDFVPPAYWTERSDEMSRLYLPASENYACKGDDGRMLGFISLSDGHIEALFVDPETQGRGVGRALLRYAGELYPELTLAVYEKNGRAVEFYRNNGFGIYDRRVDEETGQWELLMRRILL